MKIYHLTFSHLPFVKPWCYHRFPRLCLCLSPGLFNYIFPNSPPIWRKTGISHSIASNLEKACNLILPYICGFYTLSPPLGPPPPINMGLGLGVYWNHFVCLSICSSVCVSDHVCSVSPELLNHFLPNLVWSIVVYLHEVMCPVEKLVHCL